MDSIDEYLLETIKVDRIVKLDEDIADLFQNVFYSFSNDIHIDIDEPGVVTHLLMNWKHSIEVSTIFKTLPTSITGSIIEGSCLSRIFHPSNKSLELEADIMYIVGSIDEQTAQEIFEDVGNPGFIKILFSPKITLFTSDKRLSLLNIKDMDGARYIDGTKLKIMHQNVQPKQTCLQFLNGVPNVITIEQKISGPSSEIVFNIHQLYRDQDIDIVLEFLEWSKEKFIGHCNRVRTSCNDLFELYDIIKTVLKVLVDFNKSTINEKQKIYTTLTEDEAKEMRIMLTTSIENFEKMRTNLYEIIMETREYVDTVLSLDSQTKDEYFKDCFENYVLKSVNYGQVLKENTLKMNANDYGEKHEEFVNLSTLKSRYDGVSLQPFEEITKSLYDFKEKFINKIHILTSKVQLHRGKGVDNECSISFDNVSCFYCPFWPDVAEEWKTRSRKWPSQEHIENIIKAGTFLVSKQSDQGNDHVLEWRWSFSSAEIALAKLRSSTMKYVYFIFKSMFYQYFKEIPGCEKSMPSYIAKTCMLYVSEEYDESWWNKVGVTKAVLHLFKYLQQCLQVGTLLHYFIKNINLLAFIPDVTMKKALQIASNICVDPKQYFRFDSRRLIILEHIFQEVDDIGDGFKKLSPPVSSQSERFVYVTSLYQNLLLQKAMMTRCKYLNQYYGLLVHKEIEEKTLAKMDHFFATNDESNPEYDLAIQFKIQYENKLTETMSKINLMGKAISESLLRISHLLKSFCKQCDSCSQSIPCQSAFYHCMEGCDYDLCTSCYKGAAESHEHTVQPTNECSKNCYTQFDLNLYGSNATESFENVFAHFKIIKEKTLEISVQLGFQEQKDMTKIFKQQAVKRDMNYLLEKLELNESLGEEEQQAGLLTLPQSDDRDCNQETLDEKHKDTSYKEHIEEIQNLVDFIEKRTFIKNIVFP